MIVEFADLERFWSQEFDEIESYCEQKQSHVSHYGVPINFSEVSSCSQLWQDSELRSGQ